MRAPRRVDVEEIWRRVVPHASHLPLTAGGDERGNAGRPPSFSSQARNGVTRQSEAATLPRDVRRPIFTGAKRQPSSRRRMKSATTLHHRRSRPVLTTIPRAEQRQTACYRPRAARFKIIDAAGEPVACRHFLLSLKAAISRADSRHAPHARRGQHVWPKSARHGAMPPFSPPASRRGAAHAMLSLRRHFSIESRAQPTTPEKCPPARLAIQLFHRL